MNTPTTMPGGAGLPRGNLEDRAYDSLRQRMQNRFVRHVEELGDGVVFTTDATGLWEHYLRNFESAACQYHNCHACQHFIERYGGLVIIGEEGETSSPLWSPGVGDDVHRESFSILERAVHRANVTGVFLSSDAMWGHGRTGIWTHLAVMPPPSMLHLSRLQTPFQAMAEKAEDFKNVRRALGEMAPVMAQALALVKSDALYRSEKVLGQIQWLYDLQEAIEKAPKNLRTNVLWKAIAKAPAGFCHPRSSMIGTLLEDIAAGMAFEDVARRFRDKMHPLQYQRPQAAPAAGNIAEAEKMVAKLGIERSLARRYARLDEVQALWRPKPVEVKDASGVFAHLQPKEKHAAPRPLRIPPTTMTWYKFHNLVLLGADAIEFWVPPGASHYAALITAVHADAPPILQWDREEDRNPVSWYLYMGGSSPSNWALRPSTWHPVSAITWAPHMWKAALAHQPKSVFFLLDKCRDLRGANPLCLFPEILNVQMRGIRSTIEAYSAKGKLEGAEEASACGLLLHATNGAGSWNARFRVTTKGQTAEYILDRWD